MKVKDIEIRLEELDRMESQILFSVSILSADDHVRLAREKGLDALEADLKMRNAIDLPLRVSKADLDKFSDNVKYNTVLYVKILMAVTMHDEFGFGNKRIKQMFERFDNKAECIAEDYSTWEEQISIIAEECGIDMDSERRDLRTVIK